MRTGGPERRGEADAALTAGPFLAAQTAQAKALAILRIFVGLTWLKAASHKGDSFAGDLPGMLETFIAGNPHDAYAAFLRDVAIPHADLFAGLVRAGEWGVGICLLLGVAVGATGLVGAFMTLNFFLATGHFGPPNFGFNAMMTLTQIVLAFAAGGTTWGLDRRLMGRLPRWMITLPFLGARIYEREV